MVRKTYHNKELFFSDAIIYSTCKLLLLSVLIKFLNKT